MAITDKRLEALAMGDFVDAPTTSTRSLRSSSGIRIGFSKPSAFRSSANRSSGSAFQSASTGSLRQATGLYGSVGSAGRSLFNTSQNATPAFNSMVNMALNYDPQWLVDTAANDVRSSYDKTRGIMERNMTRYGINPNSGRFANLQSEWSRALAAAESGAKTKASRQAWGDRFSALSGASNAGANMAVAGIDAMSTGAQGLRGTAGDWGSLASGQAESAGYDEGYTGMYDVMSNVMRDLGYGN